MQIKNHSIPNFTGPTKVKKAETTQTTTEVKKTTTDTPTVKETKENTQPAPETLGTDNTQVNASIDAGDLALLEDLQGDFSELGGVLDGEVTLEDLDNCLGALVDMEASLSPSEFDEALQAMAKQIELSDGHVDSLLDILEGIEIEPDLSEDLQTDSEISLDGELQEDSPWEIETDTDIPDLEQPETIEVSEDTELHIEEPQELTEAKEEAESTLEEVDSSIEEAKELLHSELNLGRTPATEGYVEKYHDLAEKQTALRDSIDTELASIEEQLKDPPSTELKEKLMASKEKLTAVRDLLDQSIKINTLLGQHTKAKNPELKANYELDLKSGRSDVAWINENSSQQLQDLGQAAQEMDQLLEKYDEILTDPDLSEIKAGAEKSSDVAEVISEVLQDDSFRDASWDLGRDTNPAAMAYQYTEHVKEVENGQAKKEGQAMVHKDAGIRNPVWGTDAAGFMAVRGSDRQGMQVLENLIDNKLAELDGLSPEAINDGTIDTMRNEIIADLKSRQLSDTFINKMTDMFDQKVADLKAANPEDVGEVKMEGLRPSPISEKQVEKFNQYQSQIVSASFEQLLKDPKEGSVLDQYKKCLQIINSSYDEHDAQRFQDVYKQEAMQLLEELSQKPEIKSVFDEAAKASRLLMVDSSYSGSPAPLEYIQSLSSDQIGQLEKKADAKAQDFANYCIELSAMGGNADNEMMMLSTLSPQLAEEVIPTVIFNQTMVAPAIESLHQNKADFAMVLDAFIQTEGLSMDGSIADLPGLDQMIQGIQNGKSVSIQDLPGGDKLPADVAQLMNDLLSDPIATNQLVVMANLGATADGSAGEVNPETVEDYKKLLNEAIQSSANNSGEDRGKAINSASKAGGRVNIDVDNQMVNKKFTTLDNISKQSRMNKFKTGLGNTGNMLNIVNIFAGEPTVKDGISAGASGADLISNLYKFTKNSPKLMARLGTKVTSLQKFDAALGKFPLSKITGVIGIGIDAYDTVQAYGNHDVVGTVTGGVKIAAGAAMMLCATNPVGWVALGVYGIAEGVDYFFGNSAEADEVIDLAQELGLEDRMEDMFKKVAQRAETRPARGGGTSTIYHDLPTSQVLKNIDKLPEGRQNIARAAVIQHQLLDMHVSNSEEDLVFALFDQAKAEGQESFLQLVDMVGVEFAGFKLEQQDKSLDLLVDIAKAFDQDGRELNSDSKFRDILVGIAGDHKEEMLTEAFSKLKKIKAKDGSGNLFQKIDAQTVSDVSVRLMKGWTDDSEELAIYNFFNDLSDDQFKVMLEKLDNYEAEFDNLFDNLASELEFNQFQKLITKAAKVHPEGAAEMIYSAGSEYGHVESFDLATMAAEVIDDLGTDYITNSKDNLDTREKQDLIEKLHKEIDEYIEYANDTFGILDIDSDDKLYKMRSKASRMIGSQ